MPPGNLAAEPPFHRSIRDALRDGLNAYDARGILIVQALEATRVPSAPEAPLYQALYTLFRGLPARLPPGAALYISTRDRQDGAVELAWEARERPGDPAPEGGTLRETLRVGPYGDLLDLALLGLEAICRAQGAMRELAREPDAPTSASAIAHELAGHVRRRYAFVLPSSSSSAAGADA